MKKTVSIIFCTCDAYSDLWENFFRLFRKYWPEYDGEIILNTERKSFSYEGLNISAPLNCGPEVSWSERLYRSLERTNNELVLIFLDDFYLKGRVDNSRFEDTVNYMRKRADVASITYLNEPGGEKDAVDLPGFLFRKHFSVYKMTAHLTLYRKSFLQKILRKNESAWQFEVNGTIRSWATSEKFLCSKENDNAVFPYDFGALVVRGSFVKPIKEYFELKEDCVFSKSRPEIETLEFKPSAGILRKAKYLLAGLASFFGGRLE